MSEESLLDSSWLRRGLMFDISLRRKSFSLDIFDQLDKFERELVIHHEWNLFHWRRFACGVERREEETCLSIRIRWLRFFLLGGTERRNWSFQRRPTKTLTTNDDRRWSRDGSRHVTPNGIFFRWKSYFVSSSLRSAHERFSLLPGEKSTENVHFDVDEVFREEFQWFRCSTSGEKCHTETKTITSDRSKWLSKGRKFRRISPLSRPLAKPIWKRFLCTKHSIETSEERKKEFGLKGKAIEWEMDEEKCLSGEKNSSWKSLLSNQLKWRREGNNKLPPRTRFLLKRCQRMCSESKNSTGEMSEEILQFDWNRNRHGNVLWTRSQLTHFLNWNLLHDDSLLTDVTWRWSNTLETIQTNRIHCDDWKWDELAMDIQRTSLWTIPISDWNGMTISFLPWGFPSLKRDEEMVDHCQWILSKVEMFVDLCSSRLIVFLLEKCSSVREHIPRRLSMSKGGGDARGERRFPRDEDCWSVRDVIVPRRKIRCVVLSCWRWSSVGWAISRSGSCQPGKSSSNEGFSLRSDRWKENLSLVSTGNSSQLKTSLIEFIRRSTCCCLMNNHCTENIERNSRRWSNLSDLCRLIGPNRSFLLFNSGGDVQWSMLIFVRVAFVVGRFSRWMRRISWTNLLPMPIDLEQSTLFLFELNINESSSDDVLTSNLVQWSEKRNVVEAGESEEKSDQHVKKNSADPLVVVQWRWERSSRLPLLKARWLIALHIRSLLRETIDFFFKLRTRIASDPSRSIDLPERSFQVFHPPVHLDHQWLLAIVNERILPEKCSTVFSNPLGDLLWDKCLILLCFRRQLSPVRGAIGLMGLSLSPLIWIALARR